MEITIRTKYNKIIIDYSKSIISIQSDNNQILNNLINDYDPVVIENNNLFFIGETVFDELKSFNKNMDINIVNDIIKKFDLNSNFLDKKINELSTTEKIYLNFLRNVSKIKNIIIFKNIFLGLDLYNQKKYINIINYLKEKYVVFILSDDVNVLYKLSDYSIISSKKEIKNDKCDIIYSNVKDLIKMNLEIPDLSYITYKAKEEKNIKLFYSKDVRDIIKDIYKHV